MPSWLSAPCVSESEAGIAFSFDTGCSLLFGAHCNLLNVKHYRKTAAAVVVVPLSRGDWVRGPLSVPRSVGPQVPCVRWHGVCMYILPYT